MFWTYFFMLMFLGLGGAISKMAGELWDSGDGFVAFMLMIVTGCIGLGIVTAVFVWADAINILARFGA